MNNKENYFLTTTLPYPNSEDGPHVGFLFEAVLLDAVRINLKQQGKKVFYNTGLDEEGLKIYKKAKELKLTPENYLEKVLPKYTRLFKNFHIKYDNFYRTSSPQHSKIVQKIWNKIYQKGDIYKKNYQGNYCSGCEEFKTDKQIENGKCESHPNVKLEKTSEENYFFRITKYKNKIKDYIINSNFLKPDNKNEFLNLIKDIEDISISRLKENCPWGTEVPNDDNQIIYIWFSALCNYIIAAGYDTKNFNWDNVIQTCGTDNLKFQAIIFQAILASLDIKFSDKLLVHGIILDKDGKKMSKSIGNTINPFTQLEKYGIEAVRYYILSGLNTYSKSSWDEKHLVAKFNGEICNDWGNLVARVLHLIDKKNINIDSIENNKYNKIKLKGRDFNINTEEENTFKETVLKDVKEILKHYNEFNISKGLEKLNNLVNFANKYINDKKPWNSDDYVTTLYNLYWLIKWVNELYKPVFPHLYEYIKESIDKKEKVIIFRKIKTTKYE